MVRFEIIHLFPEENRPHILAEKLDHVQGIGEPGAVAREAATRQQSLFPSSPSPEFNGAKKKEKESKGNEPLRKTLPDSIPQRFEAMVRGFPQFLVVQYPADGGDFGL